MVDFQRLLEKYMAVVVEQEGYDYILDCEMLGDAAFTAEELSALKAMSTEQK